MCTRKDVEASEAPRPQGRPVSDTPKSGETERPSSTAWLTLIYQEIGVS